MARTISGALEAPALETVEQFIALSYVIQQAIAASAAGADLSNVQMRLLAVLRDRKPTMGGLGALLDLEKSSVTGLVDRAEERGFVRRTRPSADRRAIHVTLTARGRALDARLRPTITGRVAQLLHGLSAREQRQLARVMNRVAELLMPEIA